ncbi:PREDICTED: translocase of chloroplast 33, chloroplastic-like [Amphimedon queenslandica]|uniref:AIG1-type G domain-containing protein n=1 Tax=Amphimedon queenslandica TaxID=400682 RepID=A0AAN0ILD9_AMPQE|nr:PREDICTED: translocase of chloroplast 33, chloroplastic-like [Amphimedon queenslandica]|eukprot:XP_011403881.1 PREDICTED: translocase of chloroplast 33, chloroplastic-like [Amphimedon queenslandica]
MASQSVVFVAVCISLISLTGGGNKNAIPSLKIFVVGRTGSGKSTLINGLFGSEKAEVGDGLDAQTKDIECFVELYHSEGSETQQKFKVTICDSPGFRDPTFSNSDEEYARMLQACVPKDPDLVLFVVSMEETRWTRDQIETVTQVNKVLGKEIWKNTLLVLTFANKVNDVEKKNEFLKKFVQSLDKIGVNTDNMSVALAGHLSKGEGDHLPKHGIKYWYTELLIKGVKRVKTKGLDALMLLILKNKDNVTLTDKNKAILCNIFNNRASRAVFATVLFATAAIMSPFGFLVTGLVSTGAAAAGYWSTTTLDEFCSEYDSHDEL